MLNRVETNQRKKVFPPPRKTKKRVRGVRRRQVAFKPPPELEAWLEKVATRGGYSMTDVVIEGLEVWRDAWAVLGDDWFEIERLAKVEEKSVGELLGRFVQAGMGKGRR